MTLEARRLVVSQFWWRHLAFALLLFGAWEIYASILDESVLLPGPTAVLAALVNLVVDGRLFPALLESLRLLAIGFLTAALFGIVFGVVVGRYKLMDRIFSPYFNGLYALPIVALVPLVLVWFGFGLIGRVIVVFLSAFFPVLINSYTGVRQAPGDLIEVATAFGVKREFDMLRRVVVPAAIPFIMAGIRLGIGRGIVGMAIAEVYLRLSGLGALIVAYGSVFRTDHLIAAILPLPLLGIGLTKLFAHVEKRFRYWRVSATE